MFNRIFLIFLFAPLFGFYAQQYSFPNNDFLFEISEINQNNYEFNFKLDQITFAKVVANNTYYTTINKKGFYEHQEIGKPGLPQFNELIEIPTGGEIKITIKKVSFETIDLNQLQLPLIKPHQRSISKSEDPSQVVFEKDPKYYNQNKFMNYELVSLIKKGIIRKHQMSRLEICPFEYNPSTNELKVYYDIKFEIQFLKADLNQTRLNYAAYNQA